jgi:NAD(P)-dependent dehydrogenase (short-subunit alcohol dehydrogenase family)
MGEHVIILGGTSGIGLATASLLSSRGYRVTVAGRDPVRRASASEYLGENVECVIQDAAETKDLHSFFGRRAGFDHLVLAFGSTKGLGAFTDIAFDNVVGGFVEKVFPQFACAQAAHRFIDRSGSIVFLSAVTAFAAIPGTASIGAANAAIAALVPVLASELRPLRVNGVAPGVIDTPWWDFFDGDQKMRVFADFASKTPVGRIGAAEDIAEAIAFLVSNKFMTGQTIVCDGGIGLSS